MVTETKQALFRFIQISDMHLCQQPWRTNIYSLFDRDLHKHLDTGTSGHVPSREWNSIVAPGSYIPEIQRGVAQFCYRYRGKLDGIIIAGDLATTGKGIDLQTAKSFIKDPPTGGPFVKYNYPTIQGIVNDAKLHIVPGNHDRYQDDLGTPGSPNFVAMFNFPHMRNWDGDIGYWTCTKEKQSIAFIYADFSLRRRLQVKNPIADAYGQGVVSQAAFSKLVAKTRELKQRCQSVVWVIHFAPFVCDPRLTLVGFDQLTRAAAKLRVLCTLCGHTHDQRDFTADNHRVLCGGAAGAVDRKMDSRVHVLEFLKDDHVSSVTRRNFLWDWTKHAFIPEGEDAHTLMH